MNPVVLADCPRCFKMYNITKRHQEKYPQLIHWHMTNVILSRNSCNNLGHTGKHTSRVPYMNSTQSGSDVNTPRLFILGKHCDSENVIDFSANMSWIMPAIYYWKIH